MGSEGGGGAVQLRGTSARMVVTEAEVLARRGYVLKPGKLGEGRYSKVREAIQVASGRHFAVKIVDKGREGRDFFEDFLRQELEILGSVSHPHIAQLHQAFPVGHKWFIVLELAAKGNLLSLLQDTGAQPESLSRRWFAQLLSALAYLHGRRISHRDVKLENILLTESGEIRLTDFTFAHFFPPGTEESGLICGSRAYFAPEVISGLPFSPWKADVFAGGVVLFILLVGRMPLNEDSGDLGEQHRARRFIRALYASHPGVSEAGIAFTEGLLAPDPRARPSVFQAQASPWFLAPLLHDPGPCPTQSDADLLWSLLHPTLPRWADDDAFPICLAESDIRPLPLP